MPATEHAPCSRLYVLEDRQGLITIVLSCVLVVIEAFRQDETKTDRAPVAAIVPTRRDLLRHSAPREESGERRLGGVFCGVTE